MRPIEEKIFSKKALRIVHVLGGIADVSDDDVSVIRELAMFLAGVAKSMLIIEGASGIHFSNVSNKSCRKAPGTFGACGG